MRFLSRGLGAAALAGSVLLCSAPAPGQQVPVKSYVARALHYYERGNDPAATAFARLAVRDNPENAYAHWLLGFLLTRQREREEAVESFVRASALKPDWEVPREALRGALREGAPRWLSPEAMERMPGEVAAAETRLRADGSSAARTASCRAYLPPADASGPPLVDPKYGWEFSRHAYTYLRAADAPRWDRRFAVHYERPEDAALARRVATLLGQLQAVAEDRLGPRGRGAPAETHVWLCTRGTAGGEEWRGNLYLYETGRARSAGEWVREVAHELGHVAIPGTRHYTDPEPMGNGYLGERLMPLWLADAGNERLWDGEVSLAEYVRARVFPAAGAFLNAGPEATARSARTRPGMEYAIGLVLALELAHAPELIEELLRREVGATADNLLTAYRDRIRSLRPPAFTVHARALVSSRSEGTPDLDRAVGRRLAYRVFLPAGKGTVTLEGERLAGVRVRFGGAPLARAGAGAFGWRAATSGWQLIELVADQAMTLRRLRFAPAGGAVGFKDAESGNMHG